MPLVSSLLEKKKKKKKAGRINEIMRERETGGISQFTPALPPRIESGELALNCPSRLKDTLQVEVRA